MADEDKDHDQNPPNTPIDVSRHETITIPTTSVDIPESDQAEVSEVNESEEALPSRSHEHLQGSPRVDEKATTDDSVSDVHDLESPMVDNPPLAKSVEPLEDLPVALLEKINAVKESLKTSVRECFVAVKVVLFPVGQEIIIPFRIDTSVKQLKHHFSGLLNIPHDVLKIRHSGITVKDNETLLQLGVKPDDIIQLDIFSADPESYPIKTIHELSDSIYYIIVQVQTDINQYQEVAVEIRRSDFHKPFLGGFRHKITGVEYHHAGTQTVPKKVVGKDNVFSRDTQTVFERKKLQQTTNTTSTQMTKIGVYVSNITDKLITPGIYFSADEYHNKRLQAAIVIQTFYRQWHAKVTVEGIRRQKNLRLKWEEEEKQRKIKEQEKMMQRNYYRRHNPQGKDDFELLYHALELWRRGEVSRVEQTSIGAEKKASLCEILEKEIQLISSIGRHRDLAYGFRKEKEVETFLDKCSASKVWKSSSGKIIEMDTQFTIRASELKSIYKCILLRNISQDERLDVLLTLKHTVKEHECKLTHEILELIDREVDLMMRGVKEENLEGLRKRIATLFLQYIKTPLFNPEVARYLKVPQDPLKLYKSIYFCRSCQQYLPSTEFSLSSTTQRIYRCRNCSNLDNETRQRESFLKYKFLLKRLYASEACYGDDSKIAFLMQLQDIQYLTENIWSSQSILSAWKDINDLVMVRWNQQLEWSPWNCILLTKDEALSHLRLENIEMDYHPLFIHKIKHKHILAKNYFSQIPDLASFILGDSGVKTIREKYHTEKITTIKVPSTTSKET